MLGSAPSVPPRIVVPPDSGDTAALEEFLSDRRGAQVEVRTPARGEKRRLQELAERNARFALEYDLLQSEQRRLRRVEALEELREALNLESLPLRIECYDISNIQEESPVGAMVVFQDAAPKKAHYRKFGVRRHDGPDDFAAIAEVVSRRFARLRDETADEYDESFAAMPNLVLIDGGKGQLSAALAAMQASTFRAWRWSRWRSARKRSSCRAVPSRSSSAATRRASSSAADPRRGTPVRARLPPAAAGCQGRGSILDELQGIGPVRRRALLRHFGSAERLLEATQEELEGVPGSRRRRPRGLRAAAQGRPRLGAAREASAGLEPLPDDQREDRQQAGSECEESHAPHSTGSTVRT